MPLTGSREPGIEVAVATTVSLLMLMTLVGACSEPSAQPTDPSGSPVVDANGGSLGVVHFPTSCAPGVQADLERGLALLHHMNYLAAEPVFLGAAEADPDCALAYWGAAMTFVHPLWPDTISPARLEAGRRLLAEAADARHTSEREDGFLAALARYYEGDERTERERLAAFLQGWTEVHTQYPDDVEAALFHALALLAVAEPSDKSYARQQEAGQIIAGALARLPKHPGAHHYLIHAYDFPPLAEKALDVARRYDDLAPENTHALHMTSHIFTRLGLWPESIEFNDRAAAAAIDRTPAGEVSMHHFHALDYLAYAHLQTADDEAAEDLLVRLQQLEPPFQDHAATVYAFAGVPSRLALERRDWRAAAEVPVRWPESVQWDRYPHLEAIPWFARALGAAHIGQPTQARAAITELRRLEAAAAELDSAYDWGIQVQIQRVAAESWLAHANNDVEKALALAREAADLEGTTEKNPVTPGEVLPARELYGDLLLAVGRHAEASDAYEATLERSPNRFMSLYGAARAAELAGDRTAAETHYGQLVAICPSPTGERAELARAREFLDS